MTESLDHPSETAPTGRTAATTHVVSDADTATSVGSGDLPVLGTPVLLAWCEAATCTAFAPDLDEGQTSVGTTMRVEHLGPTAVGAEVRVEARLTTVEGRRLQFEVEVRDHAGSLVGRAEIGRVVVDAQRFMLRMADQQ